MGLENTEERNILLQKCDGRVGQIGPAKKRHFPEQSFLGAGYISNITASGENQYRTHDKNEPNPALRFLKKSAGIMAAVGIMTLNPNYDFLGKKGSMENGPEFLIEHAVKKNPLLKKELQAKIDFLIDAFSKDAIDLMVTADFQARREKDKIAPHPNVKGFEKLGIDPKYLLKIFSEEEGCYPKGTINKNIANVSYVKKEFPLQAQYGIPGRFIAGGVASYNKDDIVFFQIPASYLPKEEGPLNAVRARAMVRHFGHELGHMGEASLSNFLSPKERIDFLCDVTNTFPNSGMAKSERFEDYVGQIKNKDQKKEYYLVISEYWAILCESYFNEPEKFFATASPEEQALIKKWLLRETGKDFDPVAARDKRHYLTEQMVAGQMAKQNRIAKPNQKMEKAAKIATLLQKKNFRGKKTVLARKR
jgi:hypothetical protein